MKYDFRVLVPMFANSKINSDYGRGSGPICEPNSITHSGVLTMLHKEIHFSLLPSKMVLLAGGEHRWLNKGCGVQTGRAKPRTVEACPFLLF